MSPVLELKSLDVTIRQKGNEKHLVKNVSYEVYPGECLGILGESGSGKSMSIKAAMGLLGKDFTVSGSARFMSEELIGKDAEVLRRLRGGKIGIVLQNPMTCFDPLYRIGYQIAETLSAHGVEEKSEIHDKSIAMLKKMRIREPEEVLQKYPNQLSGGMLQRIMIGIAISMEPDLIIADEPTTAIDAITQFEILKEFKRIKEEEKVALLFISHDLNAISFIADRIVVLNSGCVVDKGSFLEILAGASDPYTRLLVEKRAAVMKRYRNALEGHSA